MAENQNDVVKPLVYSQGELNDIFDSLRESEVDSPSNVFAQTLAEELSSRHPELISYEGLRSGTAPFFDTIPGLVNVPPSERRLDDVGIMEAFLVNPDGQPMRRGDFWKGFRGEIAPQGGGFAGAVFGGKTGMAMQAGIPVVPGPTAVPAIVAKAFIPFSMTLLGAVMGQEGVRKVQKLITGEPDLITPGTTASEEAGKTAATVAGFFAVPYMLPRNLELGAATYLNNVRNFVGPRTEQEIAKRVGDERSVKFIAAIERLLSGQAQRAQTTRAGQISTGVQEAIAGAGMTGGAYAAESLDPDDTLTRIGAETLGALSGGYVAGPFALLASNLGNIKNAFSGFLTRLSEEGVGSAFGMTGVREARLAEGADKIRELIEAAPEEDMQQIIKALAELDPNLQGIDLTAGAKTGSPVLLSIEEAINMMVPAVGAQRDQATDQAIEALKNSLTLTMRSGSREALRESANLLNGVYLSALSNRLSARTEAVVDAFNQVGTDRSNQELSQALFDVVEQQLSLARQQERQLWGDIPSYTIDLSPGETPDVIATWQNDLPSTPEAAQGIESALKPLTQFIARKTEELGLGVAAEGENLSPSLQQVLDGVDPGTLTSTELVDMRSTALNLARSLGAQGLRNEARIASNFAEAALRDLEKISDQSLSAAYQGAREFSRALNDVFTRSLAGDILETTRSGGQKIAPELLAQRLLAGGSDPVELRFNQIQEIGRFGLDNEFAGAAQTVQDLDTIYEAILRSARSAALIPGKPLEEGGRINVQALNRWMGQNEDLLNQFPALRSDLSNLNTAQTLLTRTEAYNKRKAQEIKNTINFQNLMGKNADSPSFAVAQALSSGNKKPMTSLNSLARVANNAPEEMRESARAGLRASVLQWAMESAGMSGGRFSPEVMNQKLFGAIPNTDSGLSVMDWMKKSNLISAEEAQRTQQVLAQMLRYERAAKGGALEQMAEESGPLFDLFLRIAGAKLGTMGSEMLGGGSQSLIAAGAGSRAIRNIFSNMPNVLNMDVMAELIRNPQLLADMLAKPKTEKARLQLGQKLLDFFGSQGITISRRPAPTAIREFAEDIFEDVVPPVEVEEEPEVTPPLLPPEQPRTTGPLSVQNNNPGNLRLAGQPGAVEGEGGFAAFASPGQGLRALTRQVVLDTQTRDMSLEDFLNKYAPPSENETNKYIDFVERQTGLDAKGKVPESKVPQLVRAIVRMEGGQEAIDYFYGQPQRAEAEPPQRAPLAQAAPPQMPPAPPAPAPITPQSLARTAQVLGPQDEIGMLASELMMRQRPS